MGNEKTNDVVNHPSHYETGKFECIEVMEEIFGKQIVMSFCIGNAFKYLYRHLNKNNIEDIRKAKWYIDKFLDMHDNIEHKRSNQLNNTDICDTIVFDQVSSVTPEELIQQLLKDYTKE